jgi:uncharacterized membrane protein
MAVEYEQTIEIGAPADRVWAVLSDVERWPDWNQSVTGAQLLDGGGLRTGQRARLRQPRLPVAVWTVGTIEPGQTFAWHSDAAGLRSLGEHTVEPQGPGASRVLLRLTHSGALAGLVRLVYGGLIRRYVRLEAEGLKRAAETV